MEDVRALAVSGRHGTETLQHIDGPLDFISAGAACSVEAGGLTASALSVGLQVATLGNGVSNLATLQIATIAA